MYERLPMVRLNSCYGLRADVDPALNAQTQDQKATARLVLIIGISSLFLLYLIKASHFAITEGFEYAEEADNV